MYIVEAVATVGSTANPPARPVRSWLTPYCQRIVFKDKEVGLAEIVTALFDFFSYAE
jgi:hypothetical protein